MKKILEMPKIYLAIVIGIIIVIFLIVFFILKKNSQKVDIQYTNQLNYVTYTDDGGNYVIQYDNGDKTIETRTTQNTSQNTSNAQNTTKTVNTTNKSNKTK